MTLSRRVLSREASSAEDDDDRYDNIDSRYNRIVVDKGEESDDSSIYDDNEDDDNDTADDDDDLSEQSVLEDDAGVVKVQKRTTTTTHTIANKYHAAVINKRSNYESDSSEGSEHVGAAGVANRYELVKAMFKILSPHNVPLEIFF